MAISGSDDGQRAQELLEKGAGLYEEGKLYEAISCWRQVLAIDPDNEIAAEYLRFIEDNFQIGIDTFLEHHRDQPGAPGTFDGDDDDIAAAIDDSINAMLDESIEELDWSELLDDASEPVEPPPPSEVAEVDEAFFADLDPSSLSSDPGAEAEAWGRSLRSPAFGSSLSTGGGLLADGSLEMMPDADPFTLPTERFAVEYAPGESEMDVDLIDGPQLDDPLAESMDPTPRVESGPPAAQRQRDPAAPKRRDLADMSEDSIDSMLDEDFRAWEQGAESSPPADSFELPFEHPRGGPNGPTTPDARPAQPPLDARGTPVERRRTPSMQGDMSPRREHPLQRTTGPLAAVDPRIRAETGVQRAARTTPPTPVRMPPEATPEPAPRPSSMPPPLPPEALAERPEPPRGVPKAQARSEEPTDSAERRQAADSIERLRASEAERPAPEPEPATDLDDDLRALLTAGIAEIEAVERPAARPRRLISAPPPGTDLDALMVDARRRQQADDFSGAIALVEQVLAANPQHGEARRYLEANTDRLLAMYRARLGSLGRIPRVKLRQQEIVWQSLDHREGFILSQVDGRTSFEEIVDISGMPEIEATRILARLVDHGVIG